ncbi:conserved hypothetical protein [Perkinsus marinus ATCC 50983]|uniref:Purple acid phosphatase n=2 Tax=Perkinsus marinus (strain ATCC 50983 / TXsc) TaxID=423536 RepID=C5LS76_PERM5|nr:conserved hypothetical protein [Perkinsus marinus ATCC 50983]EER00438.1 conserved hypothetical protein [Perkinsus marinus ATCC 50983]|eukprot:XP_002767720.1 conserved hypothetical protein [Perkinsus marinus ATCC 50983]
MTRLVIEIAEKAIGAALLLFALCHLEGCASSSDSKTSTTSPTATIPPATLGPAVKHSCLQYFALTPKVLQHSYDPVNIRLKKGVNPLAGDAVVFALKDNASYSMLRVVASAADGPDGYELRPVNPRGGGYRVSYQAANGEVACITDLTFAQGDDEPTQAYLTVTGDDSLQVNWVSGSSERGEVLYKKPGTTTWTLFNETSLARTYKAQDMCSAPATSEAFRDPGFFHSVTIPNVERDSVLQIKTGNGVSKEFTTSPRLLAGDALRHSVFMVGDLGTSGAGQLGGFNGFGFLQFPPSDPDRILSHMRQNDRIRLSIIYGDLAYANGFSTVWDQFGAEAEHNFGMKQPLVTSVGNHEYVSSDNPHGWYPPFGNYDFPDSGGECGVPFTHRYPVGSEEAKYWYSFDYGLVHYVMISTEHNYLNGSDQHKWLEDDLANVDRNKTPWVIVTGHRPMYTSCALDKFNGDIAEELKSNVAPLFKKYNVSIYFTGHIHAYTRTSAIDGTVHILAGSARFLNLVCPIGTMPHVEKALSVIGYIELDVVSRSELRGTFWGYNVTSGEVTVQDTFIVGS